MILYTDEQIDKIKNAGRLASRTLTRLNDIIVPGITTEDINQFCHKFIVDNGGYPTSLGYKGFPKSVCTSPNHVACHGIPNENTILKSGDIINVDIGVTVDGYIGDTSRMYFVGDVDKIDIQPKRVVQYCQAALYAAICLVKVGEDLNVIGNAINDIIKDTELVVLPMFCGHGVGVEFHHDPLIRHNVIEKTGITFQPGMVFTIEPILSVGGTAIRILKDNWTAVTKNRKPAAQWEHTIAIRSNGDVEILTDYEQ